MLVVSPNWSTSRARCGVAQEPSIRDGGLAEPDHPRADRIAARRLLPDVALADQRTHQPVDRRHRQSRPRAELRQGQRAAAVGQVLEQAERPIDGLDTVAGHRDLRRVDQSFRIMELAAAYPEIAAR